MFVIPSLLNDTNSAKIVAYLTICGEYVQVVCYPVSGNVLINGRSVEKNRTVKDTLEMYIGDTMDNYRVDELFFQNGSKVPRHAHKWEYQTFYMSHWKYYATNNIKICATILSNYFLNL